MEKVRTHDHKSPKRAGLSSRVPLDALQTVVAPEMIEEEHKELRQSTSALGASTEDSAPRTREARIAQERKAVGDPLLIEQSNTYPPTKCQPLNDFRKEPNPGGKENTMAKSRKKELYGGTNLI